MAAKRKVPGKGVRKAGSGKRGGRARAARAPTIADFMTRSPHTIGRDQTLARAHELMNAHRIRHLPVLDAGRLVGLLSQRDLYFVESLDTTTPADVTVDEAMSQDVYATPADAPLAGVVQSMIRKKHGSAVVTERAGGKVIGVFSTTDALRALLQYLQR